MLLLQQRLRLHMVGGGRVVGVLAVATRVRVHAAGRLAVRAGAVGRRATRNFRVRVRRNLFDRHAGVRSVQARGQLLQRAGIDMRVIRRFEWKMALKNEERRRKTLETIIQRAHFSAKNTTFLPTICGFEFSTEIHLPNSKLDLKCFAPLLFEYL